MPNTVLLTNIALSQRSGTEVVTEQLADALRERGHRVFIFTPTIGPLGQRMRERGHIVVDRPGALPCRPDLIHAHHTGPAMAAMAAFPGVPALFVCHDATAPFDTLPPHPGLRRLAAVDERCRARLVADGAPAGAVTLLPNAIDLRRIPPRDQPLPPRPRRALVATKHGSHLPAIRAACSAAGIALDELGSGVGHVVERPELAFAKADLVFATARTALEAAAAGAGVVVCDGRGLAGFLTAARATQWLPWNLGGQILAQPVEAGPLAAAIAEWAPDEAAAAAALVRQERDLQRIFLQVEALHAALLAEPHEHDPLAETAAVGAFIAQWVPSFDLSAPWRGLAAAVGLPAVPPQAPLAAAQLEWLAALETRAKMRDEQRAAGGMLRAAWRALMPLGIRRPLHRWRMRLVDRLAAKGAPPHP